MKHAGMGWSNGPIAGGNGRILALPSPDLLMLGSEHWHYDEAVRAGKRVLFRGMARQGFRPAELGWNVKQYVNEILRDAVRVSEPITDFVGWNEWNLQDERGDQRPDEGDLTTLYTLLGGFQFAVLTELRKRPTMKGARLHFGAWAPKDETDYVEHWRAAAELADIVDVHAYGPGPGILAHADKYRSLFPSTPIELTEWHSDFDGPETDRDTLGMLANYAAVHQDFRAYYFLYRWFDPPAHQRDLAKAIAVEGNPERYDLFREPPRVVVPAPEPIPMPQSPDLTDEPDHLFSFEELWPTIKAAGDEFGFDAQVLAGIMEQEGGFRNWRVHRDGTGHGLLGLDDNGLLPDFERWSGITVGRGQSAISIPIAPQIRYAAHALADYADRLGGPYAAARAWHRGEGQMNDTRGQQYETLIRAHVADLFGGEEGPTVPKVTYNRDELSIAQNDPWSCAPTSTRWALTALGRHPSEAWMEAQMQADGIVSEAQGLLDASGQQLAAWITAQYGEYGYSANAESATFDGLAAEFLAPANPYPGLLGGRSWGHWSGLRGYDAASGRLLLANPADGWKGVGQTMDRQQFAALGPFSLVRVLHPDLLAPATDPLPAQAPAPSIDWRAELAALFSRHDAELEQLLKRQEAERDEILAKVPA
jgi:hypothetical protein